MSDPVVSGVIDPSLGILILCRAAGDGTIWTARNNGSIVDVDQTRVYPIFVPDLTIKDKKERVECFVGLEEREG